MSAKLPDLTGQTFGLWTVIAPAENDHAGRTRYLCRCSCGKERIVNASNLRRGLSTSCGHTRIAKRADALRGRNFGPPGAMRPCAICGKLFRCPPSANKNTCSPGCSAVYQSQRHKGICNKWSEDKKCHAREAAAQTGNLKNGTAAAMKNPLNQRGPQNRCAKIWHLQDPDGNTVTVVNLLDWAREHAKDYFGMEETDRSASNIRTGFANIKRSMEGKLWRKGKPCTVSTYKGWSLIAWEDKKEDQND